jgi:hypothetical protein
VRYVDDQRFYTAADTNMERVRAMMKDAGNRSTPYPMAWLGITGYKFLIQQRERKTTAREYGPHRPEDVPEIPAVPVKIRHHWHHYPVDQLVYDQRARINQLAHEEQR